MQVTCCGYLYSPELGPLDLVIYDRLVPGDTRDAQVMPPPDPVLILPTEEETRWYAGEPQPTEPDLPDEGDEAPEEDGEEPAPDEETDAEVLGMLATPQETAARRGERQQQIRRRGPRYD